MRRAHVPTLVATLVVWCPTLAIASPGDTTWVHTFDQDFYNWATPHDATFTFPPPGTPWQKILLTYTIGCPTSPGDCDPWDRIGYLQALHDTGETDSTGTPILEPYEIARVITPYDITGSGRPGTCTWELDVTDYKSLLQGEVLLRNYIESWIGGQRGWLVTIDFAFIEGDRVLEPYRVVNLWTRYYTVFGDPARPVEAFLQPLSLDLDPETIAAKVRVITTGHGQGNTQNCAEFCSKQHTIVANGTPFAHTLWRSDCNVNPCSPQGGTWALARAGWCPGDKVTPWDVDVSGVITSGGSLALDYDISAYENFCRPDNPECVSGVTCPDCNYNSTGHTEPHLALQAQVVLYEQGAIIDVAAPGASETGVVLGQNAPNPFNPRTTITYELSRAADVNIVITNAGGRIVREVRRRHGSAGHFRIVWDGRDASGKELPSGVYFYELEGGGEVRAKRMVLLR
jgi:hypothetical protein